MTDEQMLSAAAKAVGISIGWYEGVPMIRLPKANGYSHPWNPLTDDGDAFRLAAQLGIAVSTAPIDAPDKTKWMRKAIVMLAAGVVSRPDKPEHTP